MFHSLQYDVTFPSTGRRFHQKLTLDAGFWAITGPNESGKSLVFEMMRYALFGNVALRGAADDYKTLRMSADFSIRGVRYSVERSARKAELKRGADALASGVTAVNAKVVQLLGFGVSVFDMACSVNQGEIERLGTLTPLARKQLVDQVLGIDTLDVVAKWAMEEARVLDREAASIRNRLATPIVPIVPDNYRPSADIDLAKYQAEANELIAAEAVLAVPLLKPEMPTCKVDLPAANLGVFAEKRKALRVEVESLRARVAALPTSVPYTSTQLAVAEDAWPRYDRYEEASRWLQANPKPAHSQEQLQVWLDEISLSTQWKAYDNVQANIERAKHQLSHLDSVECPACSHQFPLDEFAAEELRQRIADLETIQPPEQPRPTALTVTGREDELERDLRAWAQFDEAKYAEMEAVPPCETPPIPRAQIPVFRAQLDQVQERQKYVDELLTKERELEVMPDYEQMLVERTAYEAALPRYRELQAQFEQMTQDRFRLQATVNSLAGARERLQDAQRIHAEAVAYEGALAVYMADQERYEKEVAEANDLEAQAVEHRKVRDVMTILRSRVKQHLMPSLNKVASHLLAQMTGGQRSVVAVDEDFNVLVDGQNLDTLSGSGKAVANLALRIGLGQVLTNRVFSVLMADEIDAAMDDFRAEQTSNVLCTLEKSISQVMQVSHKQIESVNSIRVGDQVGSTLYGEAA